MITCTCSGGNKSFSKSLKAMGTIKYGDILESYGSTGVAALATATPSDTGATAAAWGYVVEQSANSASIYWTNTHKVQNVSIATILQYGHGTGTGGYVQGYDYINPAMSAIFDKVSEAAWKEVKSV